MDLDMEFVPKMYQICEKVNANGILCWQELEVAFLAISRCEKVTGRSGKVNYSKLASGNFVYRYKMMRNECGFNNCYKSIRLPLHSSNNH